MACDLILAEDGRPAISILSNPEMAKNVSIVFLDLKLPFVNGFDVLKWMHSVKFEIAPPRVVVLSGSPHIKDKLSHENWVPSIIWLSRFLVK